MIWRLLPLLVAASTAASGQTPLFSDDTPVRITIQGPIGSIASAAESSTTPREASLMVAGATETLPIRLSARGLSRRKKEVCEFPPLRVEFADAPPPASLFAGQRRLKLVTHCQKPGGFQQHLLLEYAAYRLFNLVAPASFRARLATIDYLEQGGRAVTSRYAFFIEDKDDVAKRVGLSAPPVGDTISPQRLDPAQAARVALFQYMIGNLDWSMRAGPSGEGCCHNSRLLTGPGGTFVALPYDFDYSGLVDAPYAVPPEGFRITSVRSRVYRGYCRHNAEALAAAAEFRAQRPRMEALFGEIQGLTDRSRGKARSYLANFFEEIATDETVSARILKECVR